MTSSKITNLMSDCSSPEGEWVDGWRLFREKSLLIEPEKWRWRSECSLLPPPAFCCCNPLGLTIQSVAKKSGVGPLQGEDLIDQGSPAPTFLQNQSLLSCSSSEQCWRTALILSSEKFPSAQKPRGGLTLKRMRSKLQGLSVVQASPGAHPPYSAEPAVGSLFAFSKTDKDLGLKLLKASFLLGGK